MSVKSVNIKILCRAEPCTLSQEALRPRRELGLLGAAWDSGEGGRLPPRASLQDNVGQRGAQ